MKVAVDGSSSIRSCKARNSKEIVGLAELIRYPVTTYPFAFLNFLYVRTISLLPTREQTPILSKPEATVFSTRVNPTSINHAKHSQLSTIEFETLCIAIAKDLPNLTCAYAANTACRDTACCPLTLTLPSRDKKIVTPSLLK